MVEFSPEKVRGLMAERGLKQTDLAVELCIDLTSINNKLTGKTEFKLNEIKQLARLFDVVFTISC